MKFQWSYLPLASISVREEGVVGNSVEIPVVEIGDLTQGKLLGVTITQSTTIIVAETPL